MAALSVHPTHWLISTQVTSIKAKPSLMDRCTAGVFGKALVITPSLFYMFLYSAAIVVLLALRGRARNAGF